MLNVSFNMRKKFRLPTDRQAKMFLAAFFLIIRN